MIAVVLSFSILSVLGNDFLPVVLMLAVQWFPLLDFCFVAPLGRWPC